MAVYNAPRFKVPRAGFIHVHLDQQEWPAAIVEPCDVFPHHREKNLVFARLGRERNAHVDRRALRRRKRKRPAFAIDYQVTRLFDYQIKKPLQRLG